MAFPNLDQHSRRTLLTLSSIAFGLAVILWLQCLLAGRNRNMIETVTSSRTGHLQITREDYRKDHQPSSFFTQRPELAQILPPGSAVTGRIHLPALISSGEQSAQIVLDGIEPLTEAQVTRVKEMRASGRYLEPENDPACPSRQLYISHALAGVLHVELGNKLVLMTQAADGSLGNDLFRVSGLFDSGSPDFDKNIVFTPLACAAKLGAIAGLHELVIRLPDGSESGKIKERLEASLSQTSGPKLSVTTWRESMPALATMLRFNDATLVMISAILFFVIATGIVNTLLITVFERTREFGVMAALGTEPNQVRLLVVAESLIIGLGGAVLGTVVGVAVVLYHQWKGFDLSPFLGGQTSVDRFKLDLVIYPIFRFQEFLKSLGLTAAVMVAAGIIPAIRASRMDPTEAMRSV